MKKKLTNQKVGYAKSSKQYNTYANKNEIIEIYVRYATV